MSHTEERICWCLPCLITVNDTDIVIHHETAERCDCDEEEFPDRFVHRHWRKRRDRRTP